MPAPRPVVPAAGAVSRRTAVLGAVAATTSACSPYEFQTQRRRRRPAEQPTAEPSSRADPDIALAATALAAEQAVLDHVEATLERHPRLRGLLDVAREVHRAHVELLADAVPDDPSDTPAPTTEAQAGRPAVPRSATAAVRALARHEDDLSLVDKRGAFAAESGAFARVLASMAAAAAQQSARLRTAAVPGGPR